MVLTLICRLWGSNIVNICLMALVSIVRGCVRAFPKRVLKIDTIWHLISPNGACISVGRTCATSTSPMIHHFAVCVCVEEEWARNMMMQGNCDFIFYLPSAFPLAPSTGSATGTIRNVGTLYNTVLTRCKRWILSFRPSVQPPWYDGVQKM